MGEELKNRVSRWRGERFRADWLEGSLRFGAGAGAALLAVLLADRFLSLGQGTRWFLFWSGAAACAAGAYRHYLRPLKRLEARRLISDVGRRYPHLRAYVLSAWELRGGGAAAGHASQELADEHLRRTEALLRDLTGESVFPFKPSKPAAKRTVFAAAAWGVAMPWLYNGQANFQRVLAPWQDESLDRLVEVTPRGGGVPWGAAVEVKARWLGPHANGPLVLFVRPEGGAFSRLPWDRDDGTTSSVRLRDLTEPLEYRVGYRELVSRTYRLAPIPYARFEGLTAKVRLPGEEPEARVIEVEGAGEVAALRRSWVTLRGRPDKTLVSARLRVSYLSSPVELKKLPSGEWEGGFPLNEDGTFVLELSEASGSRNPNPVVYRLRALDDRVPEAVLLSPTFEIEVSRRERLTVTYEASDDYGLRSLALLFKAGDGPERTVPLEVFRKPRLEYLGDYEWDLSGLPVGSRVEFRIKAADSARPRGQTSVSNVGVLHVVDFESAHAATERLWIGAEKTLKRLAAREDEMARRMEELARAGDEAAKGALKERAALEGDALDKEWENAVRDLKEVARTMKTDPYSNPGMTETSEMLAQVMEGMREYDFKAARDAAEEGRYEESRAGHEALGKRVARASEIMTAGRETQMMQDFWGEAHRMDQAGGEISRELDRLAESGKAPTAEEKAKLDQALAQLREQMEALSKSIEALPKADPESARDARRKVYRVPLEEAKRTADALQDAMARGDYAAAARIARQLARQLAQVKDAVAQAAQMGPQEQGESPASERLDAAKKLWEDVTRQQARSLELVDAIEEGKLGEKARAQKRLLEELAGLQKAVVRESAQAPALVPEPTLGAMRSVLREFEEARVREAPELLEKIVSSLGFRAQRFPPRDGVLPEPAKILSDLAAREKEISEKLKSGARPPPLTERQLSDMMAASAVQKQTGRKTQELAEELEKISNEVGTVPSEVTESLSSARTEQEAAEAALARRDSGEARSREQKALEHLERGRKGMEKALQRQQSIERQSTAPFSRPRGVARPSGGAGGRTGMQRGFVPLPGAEDYQPPRRMREEIEKSLQEKRPSVFDETTDDYLKRMSQ